MEIVGSPSHLRIKLQTLAGLALFSLLLFSILAPLFTGSTAAGSEGSGQGNLLRQLIYFCIFAVAIACARLAADPWRLTFIPLSIVLTLVWCTFSMGWAINPGVGVRRLALTLIVVISIFLLVERSGYARTMRIARWVLFLVLAANYLAVLGWPQWAIHQAATETDPSVVGAWRGILLQKNFAGAASSLAILFFLLDARSIRLWVKWPIVVAAAYFLLRTESKTSAALLIVSLCVGVASLKYQPRYRNVLLAGLAGLLVALAFLVPAYWDTIAAPFAREDTLTGRVQIWPPLFQFWREHWLLGAGFGSFWNIGNPEPIAAYTEGWVAEITSGHNGYLDLLVQIGLPGLLLAVVAAVFVPAYKLLTCERTDPFRRSLLASVIVFAAGHNLTESSLFDRDAAMHVVLMLAIALLGLEIRSIGRADESWSATGPN